MKNLLSFVFLITIASSLAYSQVSDAALKAIVEKDRASRSADGKLVTITAAEHRESGRAYFDNRQSN